MADIPLRSEYRLGYHKHVYTLTESQRAFPYLLDRWITHPKNTKLLVSGGPGSGKTYTVISCLDYVNLPQIRMAPTGRIAANIKGSTIHSRMKLDYREGSVLHALLKELETESDTEACLRKSKTLLDTFDCSAQPSIVVIDEVGMVAFWLIERLFDYFFAKKRPVLCIGMGDPNQLRPVGSIHNVFSAGILTERIDLRESKRFDKAYHHVIQSLRKCVDENDDNGLFDLVCNQFRLVEHVDSSMLKQCTRALTYKKETMDVYNEFYLKRMVQGPRIRLYDKNEDSENFVDLKNGCDIFVTQNGVSRVSNGTALIFQRYDEKKDVLECALRGGNEMVKVHRNAMGQFPVAVGFAGTIHRFQGDTIDDEKIVINFNESRDLNLIYTALSRVRSENQILAIQM